MSALLTTSEMAEADRLTIAAGTPGRVLMERAGAAVADIVATRWPLAERIAVLAGPGNNGGDGFVAARLLRERGFEVELQLLGDRGALRGDAALAAADVEGEVGSPDPSSLARADVVVDALFGAGLSRPLSGEAADLVAAINASGRPVVAVDVPSGLDGTTGRATGPVVRASVTVTFFRRKPGHLLMPGRELCGETVVADIGIAGSVLDVIRPKASANEPAVWRGVYPVPRSAGHKYDRGHALVLSGPATGAARLVARGALRAGAGLVTILSPREFAPVHAAANMAVMVRPFEGATGFPDALGDRRHNAIALGPGAGVGPDLVAQVEAALATPKAVVLDADAISAFAGRAAELAHLVAQRDDRPVILTPHSGEFARLFAGHSEILDAPSKLEAARRAAGLLGAVLVFKGPDTVVAAPDGRATIAENGPPWLATAGSGDVLAGFVTGLVAQRMPAFEAASAAVWLHGEAGAAFGPGLISEDLPEMLPAVLRRLLAA